MLVELHLIGSDYSSHSFKLCLLKIQTVGWIQPAKPIHLARSAALESVLPYLLPNWPCAQGLGHLPQAVPALAALGSTLYIPTTLVALGLTCGSQTSWVGTVCGMGSGAGPHALDSAWGAGGRKPNMAHGPAPCPS